MIKLRKHQQRVVNEMLKHQRGQLIVPTGGGKTMCMITDAISQFNSSNKTIVVVAPRILLTQQLSEDFLEIVGLNDLSVKVLHVHSGDTSHYSTTKSKTIFNWAVANWQKNKLIFTTYNSLNRIQEANINVDTIYFDEAHNSIQRHFFPATEYFSNEAKRCYFFTATPKHSVAVAKAGMNDVEVYGKVLCDIPAPELVKQGVILPPKVIVKKIDMPDDSRTDYEKDCENILSTLDDIDVAKVLICARNTKQIIGLMNQTHFGNQLQMRGYNVMSITSKTGAFVNGIKVDREQFFDKLNEWGKDDNARFVVLHHSILSEGINEIGRAHV